MDRIFAELIKGSNGAVCPHCDRYAKLYKRSITSTVARQLIQLYKLGGHKRYIHASKLIPKGQSGSGDLTKAEMVGLIKRAEHEPGLKKSSGYWKLTDIGFDFVFHRATIPSFFYVYNNEVWEASEEDVFIDECLSNEFNYLELMNS